MPTPLCAGFAAALVYDVFDNALSRAGNGAFVTNCCTHELHQLPRYELDSSLEKGVTMTEAIRRWWEASAEAPASAHAYLPNCSLSTHAPGGCNPSCKTRQSACRGRAFDAIGARLTASCDSDATCTPNLDLDTPPAAAWELAPTAQAEWACGAGQRNARASECLAAVVAASGGRANGHIKHVDSPDVPPGCSYSHVSGAAIFNSGAGQVGSDEEYYQLVCTQADEPSESAAASVPSPQPSPASMRSPQPSPAFAPQKDGESAGLAVCVTGQLARLELRSKVQNLLAVHGPERAGLFVVLEKGDPVYVNAKTHQTRGGCDVEATTQEVVENEALQPYLRGARFPEHKIYPVNMSEWPQYRPDLRAERDKLFHLQSHHAQFEHGQECARMMLEEEERTGKRFEAMVRVRDNGVVSAHFSPLDIVANAGSREVFAKNCNGWGGVNDKVLIVPRDMVESAFMHHIDMMSSILEDPPTWTPASAHYAATMRGISSNVRSAEELLLAFLESANLTVTRLSDYIPVIDGRCFNATEVRHVGTAADPAGKQWCAEPLCKDCNGSALPWDLDGFGFCDTTCDVLMPGVHWKGGIHPLEWELISQSVRVAPDSDT